MKKILTIISVAFLSTMAFGATVTQTVTPATRENGSTSAAINRFNSSLGTLTKVTFAISLDTYGGSYKVSSGPATGTMNLGVQVRITGINSTDIYLNAVQSKNYSLENSGSSETLTGAAPGSPFHSGVTTFVSDKSLASFTAPISTSQLWVTYYFTPENSHTGIPGSADIALATGKAHLTVTYEYTPVPEATSMALLALGIAALGLRRKNTKA